MSGSETQPNPEPPVPISGTTRVSNRVENYLRYRPRGNVTVEYDTRMFVGKLL